MALTAEDIRTLDALKQEQLALLDLLNRPGWKLITAEFQKAADHAYTLMIGTENPHQSAKHMGAFHACQNINKYPLMRLEVIKQMISHMELR